MSDKKLYSFNQYVYGRFSTGYGPRSTQGSHVPVLAQNSTRETKVKGELPTRELQSNLEIEQGLSPYTLCNSIYVDTIEQRNELGTRNFAFSQYLFLQNDTDASSLRECAQDMLKILACCDDAFWDSRVIRDWGDESLPKIELDPVTVQKKWNSLLIESGEQNALFSRDSLAVFLARYWEVCSERAIKGDAVPLILVVSSPERSNMFKGSIIVPDGIRFFVDSVIPYLPEDVLPILSVSFGCLCSQVNAQKGTACMVCYPTSDTLEESQLSVYIAYEDTLYDDNFTPTYLNIGRMLLSRSMPTYYIRLCELEKNRQTGRAFELFYNEVELEERLNAWEEVYESDRLSEIEDIEKSLKYIRAILIEEQYSYDEITYILFDLEKKYLESCEQLNEYNDYLYCSWLDGYLSLDSRCLNLSKEETLELEKHYSNLLTKQKNRLAVEQILQYYQDNAVDENQKAKLATLSEIILSSPERKIRTIMNTEDAISEWDNWRSFAERLHVILNVSEAKATQVLAEDELCVLRWYPKSGEDYCIPLFERILEGLVSLDGRTDAKDERTQELRAAYLECLTHRYPGVKNGMNPLSTLISHFSMTEKYPEILMPFEEGICKTASFMKETPCDISGLLERMLGHQIRLGDQAIGITQAYQELIYHFFPDPVTQLSSWLLVEEQHSEQENAWRWLSKDLQFFLNNYPEGLPLGSLLTSVIDQYNKLRRYGEQKELEKEIVKYAQQELQGRLWEGKEISSLIEQINNASLPMDENSQFYHLLMDEVQEEGMEAFTNEKLMEGIRTYHAVLGSRMNTSIMSEIYIACAQKKHNQIGLNFQDMEIMLRVGQELNIASAKQKEVYAKVFEDCQGEKMPESIVNPYTNFLQNNPLKTEDIKDDALIMKMLKWGSTESQNLTENMTQLLQLAKVYLNLHAKVHMARTILKAYFKVLPSQQVPSTELILNIIKTIREVGVGPADCETICDFYENRNDEDLYEQMWTVAGELGFEAERVDSGKTFWSTIQSNQNKENWIRCLLKKTTDLLCSQILGMSPVVLFKQIQNPIGMFRTWNVLYELNKDDSNASMKESNLQNLTSACREAFNQESEKSNNIVLPLAKSMQRDVGQDRASGMYACFLAAFKEHLRIIMEDEQLFRATVRNEEDLQIMEYCRNNGFFDPPTENVSKRSNAINVAFNLIEMYAKQNNSVSLNDLVILLGEIRAAQPAFEVLQDICFEVGRERARNLPYPAKDIPWLIKNYQSISSDNAFRFDWMNFLEEAHPRSEGKKWEDADILTDNDNTYGTIAALMNWFSLEEIGKPILDSFQRFLDQNNIGKKARAQRRRLNKYYDERTDNQMIHWILGKQGLKK